MIRYVSHLLLILLVFLSGCAMNADGTLPDVEPILPEEAQLIANQTTYTLLRTQDVDMETAAKLKASLDVFNSTLQSLLRENPENLEVVNQELISQYDEDVAVLVNNLTQITLLRVRRLIDQGQTNLAAQYLDRVTQGSMQAVDIYINRLLKAEKQA